jgi:hypothetical protein
MVKLNGLNVIQMDKNATNSSSYMDMRESIVHSKHNKITLDANSIYYNFSNEIIIGTSILRKYENIIRAYAIDYTIQKDHLLRPEYVSFELYSSTDLWYMLLFLNNMRRPDEFNKRNIKVLDPTFINILNDIYEKESKTGNMDNPIEISRSLIKDLNQPSKRILSSLYDKKMKPIKPSKE